MGFRVRFNCVLLWLNWVGLKHWVRVGPNYARGLGLGFSAGFNGFGVGDLNVFRLGLGMCFSWVQWGFGWVELGRGLGCVQWAFSWNSVKLRWVYDGFNWLGLAAVYGWV